ncbi:MAG TPA: alpha-L-rhamnosidase [Porphyromonadaceae bacterium]|jgi:alpha-L-rhamnosidase|nr:alpha-L-rhamnosidase [Porphyromonadaceae bacterium]
MDLVCEYETNPLGIETEKPRFSWKIKSKERNQKQSAYRIIISSSEKNVKNKKGDLWDSGIIQSDQSVHVPYGGKPLQSFTRYYWRVCSSDRDGKISNWSNVYWFETAILSNKEWQGIWIGDGKLLPEKDEDFYADDPMPLFRKSFSVDKKIKSARLYISGLGYYEAYLNGKKIGNNVLDPGWTSYQKRILYTVYDITDFVTSGANIVGLMLGNGWFNPLPLRFWGAINMRDALYTGRPAAKAMIRLAYSDGTTEIIPTDTSWETIPGPVVRNNIYLGEHYDARREIPRWNKKDEAAHPWVQASEMPAPSGVLTVQRQPPVRITKSIKPVNIYESRPNVYIADMGQNFAGVVRIKVKGAPGTKISLRYGEDIHADGSLNGLTSVAGQIKTGQGGPGAPETAWQEDSYTLSGIGVEEWSPRFTFHGFRYVEITGWPGIPEPEDITGLRMSADLVDGGEFSSSNNMFNKLDTVIQWTFLSNVFSVISDCPAREKLSYGGDILCTTEAYMFNFHMPTLYHKIIRDFTDAQRPLGGIPETAPYVGIADGSPGDKSGPLGFQLGLIYLMKKMYEFYGDTRIIAENYEAAKMQIEFLKSQTSNHLFDTDLGDHESLDIKSIPLTASIFYLLHVHYFAKFAEILNFQEDAKKYRDLSEEIKTAINQEFLRSDSGVYALGTQSDQSFALWSGVAENENRNKTLEALIAEIDRKKGHIATGIFGTKMMFDVLLEEGLSEIAYTVANQRDFPGWGHMVENGATTLWETWRYSDNMYSQNHPMFGSIGAWFYRSLLGINELEPGFRKIQFKPQPAGDLTFAEGSLRTMYGKIESSWEITGSTFLYKVSVPVNTNAIVYIPSRFGKHIQVDGKPVGANADIVSIGEEKGYMLFGVGSGVYQFEVIDQ